MQKIRLAYDVQNDSIVDGPGIRTVIWTQGCSHNCKGCHNPETWDFNSGKEFTEDTKKELFSCLALPYINGITLSGGDPLCSYDELLPLLKEIKEKFPNKNIWVYTGFTLEELIASNKTEILNYIDVLVDGKFILEQRDITLPFRGSKNQRILEQGKDF